MKVAGGLYYVVGPMGSGKSLYAVRRTITHLTAGQYVITNVELLPGWADKVADHVGRLTFTSRRRKAEIATKLESRYIYETDLAEAMKYRLPGTGESRGLFIWDETHNDLNNRSWRSDGRGQILEWSTQLRKLGFVGFLLSQHTDNTDAQLRRVCNGVVRLQNQREQMRVLGFRITPWPLFLAAWYPTHVPVAMAAKTKPMRVERYFLDWHRKLYDTHGLYHGLNLVGEESDVIMLPEGGRSLAKPVAALPVGEVRKTA